ncbi:isochorismatase family protein [Aristophania vespae]|uniref:Isochorismatase family protein n=1 Tax=Aristophania vespae TaxID=2697033 RepID=A0A6P1NCD3_9PROT|nr:cysteine hydrolase [Aristophania vespae]QHI95976.1 isochorismatase family protein [Aristophania vespae]
MLSLNFDTKKSALLLMDFQEFILKNFMPPEIASQVVKNAAHLLEAARKANIFVIHVNVSFRNNYPEISSRNKMFSWIKEKGLAIPGSDALHIHDALKPLKNEPVIHKHRMGAFTGTDLEMILRAQNIETLILSGVTTSGVVLSTFRQAFDLDFNLAVISDGCADGDAETHAFLTEKFFPHQGTVLSIQDMTAHF